MKRFQQNSAKHWTAGALIAVSLCSGVTLSGCMGGGAGAPTNQAVDQAASAPFDLDVVKVELAPKMGNNVAEGGKFLVVTMAVENTSNGDFTLKANEFNLRNITDNPKEQYQQGPESFQVRDFTTEFGAERAAKLMGNQDVVHPRFKVERTLVFKLPADALPDKYEMYHTPLKAAFPLVSDATEVVDLAVVQQMPGSGSHSSAPSATGGQPAATGTGQSH